MEIISCKEELMKEKNIIYTVGRKQMENEAEQDFYKSWTNQY